MEFPAVFSDAVLKHRYPLVFATVSGAHLYGFPSPDSDFDLRGVHVFDYLLLTDLFGLGLFARVIFSIASLSSISSSEPARLNCLSSCLASEYV